jgi:PDDEXK-like domain of unknown function (DUF3799)
MTAAIINETWDEAIVANSVVNSNSEYHSSPGVSNSMLSVYLEDPREYHYQFLSGQYVKVQKDAFDFGNAVHDICLLGDDSVVVIPPDVLTKDGKRFGKAWDAFKEENSGKLLLKASDYQSVLRCVEAVHKHPIAGPFLRSAGYSERSFSAFRDDLGIVTRCRVDRIIRWRGRTIVLDLKTTASSIAPKFVNSIANFGYANQEAFYRDVLSRCNVRIDAFVFIAVKDSEPHCVDCYTINSDWLNRATEDVRQGLASLSERIRTNSWESITSSQIIELSPPNFLNYKGDYTL